ncbi:24622_t:CDS:2 [Racocetra persica]|uniref:24622_t:CDS:1 n=1 Tax=Racocetra persica TaxID=160502 RepID=A0ACA9P4M1_9GLOM|nr:24622_t:CDS:2 [Racocetra persica]
MDTTKTFMCLTFVEVAASLCEIETLSKGINTDYPPDYSVKLSSQWNPPTRGFDEANEAISPCGGFNSVNTSAITKFPVTQGRATSFFYDGDGTLTYFYAPDLNSTFLQVSDPETYSQLANAQKSVTVNLTRANATVGSQGVLQAVFKLSDINSSWYQCADIQVVNSVSANSANSIAMVSPQIGAITLFVGFISVLIIGI